MTPGIARLDVDSVRMICSGQVIVDLAAATKELVENALDAGATSIDVRLVEYGTSAIECSDNGCGIPPSDFEIMAQRYSTSKLRDFETLRNVDLDSGERPSLLYANWRVVLLWSHVAKRRRLVHDWSLIETVP